jgi:hypothetical protein
MTVEAPEWQFEVDAIGLSSAGATTVPPTCRQSSDTWHPGKKVDASWSASRQTYPRMRTRNCRKPFGRHSPRSSAGRRTDGSPVWCRSSCGARAVPPVLAGCSSRLLRLVGTALRLR